MSRQNSVRLCIQRYRLLAFTAGNEVLSWRAVLNLGEGQNDGIILSVGIRSDLLALRGARDEACGDSDADQHAGAAGCFPARCATRVDPARALRAD